MAGEDLTLDWCLGTTCLTLLQDGLQADGVRLQTLRPSQNMRCTDNHGSLPDSPSFRCTEICVPAPSTPPALCSN